MKGVSVTVRSFVQTGVDRFNNPVVMPIEQTVDNVLIAPGATQDLEASRPEGVSVAYTLHFPKAWTDSLEGCEIDLPAPYSGTYRVIGNPGAYMDANTPTAWHMPVEIEAAHG
jgi:hypothetical protein